MIAAAAAADTVSFSLSSSPIVVAAVVVLVTVIFYYKFYAQNPRSISSSREPVVPKSEPTRVESADEEEDTAPTIEATNTSFRFDTTTMEFVMSADKDGSSMCAACYKESDSLKTCNGCKMVKYCSVTCQKTHRPAHKKACQKRARELLDEKLFEQPPPREDCPICFLRLPPSTRTTYQICCGKSICDGCVCIMSDQTNTCPFCKQQCLLSNKKTVEKVKERMKAGDAQAYAMMGSDYDDGALGLPKDQKKALELWLKAGELGHPLGYYNAACAYAEGAGVKRNNEKALHYYKLAAIGGHEGARRQLGVLALEVGIPTLAMKHFIIAAVAGDDECLKFVTNGFKEGLVTKDEYAATLRAYKESQDEMRSDQRDKAVEDRARELPLLSMLGRI